MCALAAGVVPDLTVGSPWGGGEVGNHAGGALAHVAAGRQHSGAGDGRRSRVTAGDGVGVAMRGGCDGLAQWCKEVVKVRATRPVSIEM